jgi:hypothetical protein
LVSELADIEACAFPVTEPDAATDGEPEMVGSCARRRREESDPLPRFELGGAALGVPLVDRVDNLCDAEDEAAEEGGPIVDCRRLATRWTVLLGSDIWIGGRLGALARSFFSSVEDKVCFGMSVRSDHILMNADFSAFPAHKNRDTAFASILFLDLSHHFLEL